MGEVGLAVVVPAAGSAPPSLDDELIAWAREQPGQLQGAPRGRMVDALPVNASGKVLKRELRERFAAAP